MSIKSIRQYPLIISKTPQSMKSTYGILLLIVFFVAGCKKDDEPRRWVAAYTNVNLGDQANLTTGHFFQPSTGQSVLLENTANVQKTLAMMFFTETGGANQFLTFPANGENASTWGTANIRLFTQNPDGLNFWNHADMVSGMIYAPPSTTTDQFDALMASRDWKAFDDFFTSKNASSPNLEFKAHYRLRPTAGDVYLVQFNGLVRAVLCVRNVVPSSSTGGSIRFDIIVEGREIWENNNNARHLQPLDPNN